METQGELRIRIPGGNGAGYVSSGRSSLETTMSGSSSSSSPTSTAHTSISEQGHSPLKDTLVSGVIPAPGTFVGVGEMQYASGEVRVMADIVAQARKSNELPPTKSPPLDTQTITEDYALLSRLRLARGDPALPPPEEYTRLRVEAARRIRERDARLEDDECRRVATERVESYLRVVGQEMRYYELARGVGVRDMERITEEIGTTADVLDTAASSLAYTTNTLTLTTRNLDTTATTLDATLNVTTSQISALKAQILTLTDLLQSQRAGPIPSTPHTSIPRHDAHYYCPPVANSALEDIIRREVTRAIHEATAQAQTPYTLSNYETPGPQSRSSSRTMAADSRDRESISSFTAECTKIKQVTTEREAQGKRGEKRPRRMRRYARIAIDRILG